MTMNDRFLMRAEADYHAMEPYKDKDFYDVAVYRGKLRSDQFDHHASLLG